jgi:NDP-sugar pyrophosphorylase family protein
LHFTGIARLAPATVARLVGSDERHIGKALQPLLADGTTAPTVAMAEAWHNIVYPWDLVGGNQVALRYLPQELAGTCEAGVMIRGAVAIGEGSRIAAGCYLQGPLAIGSGCRIGPGTVLGPSTAIGDGVEMGTHCEIADTLVMDSVSVGSYTHLQACVIGEAPGVLRPVVGVVDEHPFEGEATARGADVVAAGFGQLAQRPPAVDRHQLVTQLVIGGME